MGVDLSTYRCRIGSFISRRGADAGRGANDKRGADNGRGADDGRGADVGKGDGWMKFFISLCKLIEFIGSLTFIGMLLLMAGIESNPGPRENPDRTDPRFKNWARVAYGYKYLKEGLTRFISNQIGIRHSMLKVDILTQCHYVNSCSECIIYTLLPDHGNVCCNQKKGSICLCQKDPSSRKKCPNNFCGRFYHLIVNDHVENSPRWSSTDPKKWYKDELQYAKCFLSIDSSANSVSDLDCADLLTIVINNSYISHSVHEVKSFQQCLEDHNKIFFADKLEVTDSELNDFFDHMIHVLEDKECLSNDPDAQKAREVYLDKLKENSVQLSDEDIDKLLEKANQNRYIFRYQLLLIKIGTEVLRHTFDERVHPNLQQFLKTNEKKLQKLIEKRLIAKADILNSPSSSNFDISLLYCVLRNICGMAPKNDKKWTDPRMDDSSTEAYIARMRKCRNYVAHKDTVFISKDEFNNKWDELCHILHSLNSKLKHGSKTLQLSIEDAKQCFIDDESRKTNNNMLDAWEKMDGHVHVDVKQIDRMEQKLDKLDNRLQKLTGKRRQEKQDKIQFRYMYLLFEIGTKVLREIFDRRVGRDFVAYLATNRAATSILTYLMTGKNCKITAVQKKLLPPIELHPKSSMFDITLLTCLLRNICGLSPAGDPVWMNPLPTDHRIEADITRMRHYRNEIMLTFHISTSDEEWICKWQELVEILERLNDEAEIRNLISDIGHVDSDEVLKKRHLETFTGEMNCALNKLTENVVELKRGLSKT